MLEPHQSRSNLDQDWLRGMGIVSEGMLESQQSRSNATIGILPAGMLESQHLWSNLDQDWERYGDEDMLESQQSRSNLDRNWLRGMGTVSEGMLESPQSRSNLDQNWLGSIGILPAGMLESQLSWSSLVQDRLGSIGILPAGMLESQQSQSHLAEKYWHTTSRYAIYRITAPAVKSGSRLAETYDHIRSIGQIWIKTGWEVPADYQQVC